METDIREGVARGAKALTRGNAGVRFLKIRWESAGQSDCDLHHICLTCGFLDRSEDLA